MKHQNIVYFPGGHSSNHVQRLNTATREYETIKLLSFAPRCLVAGNGWLCCGSEHGEFVAIRLDEMPDDNSSPELNGYLDPDARLPLSLSRLNDEPQSQQAQLLISPSRRTPKNAVAKSMKMATDRVNCVTLWFPPKTMPACPEAYVDPMAVLANNDKTVTLVNLPEFERSEKTEPVDIITYPDYVNRAIISPDGQMLVAILDDPFLYVHKRVAGSGAVGGQWVQMQSLLLKSQSKSDRSDSRGSFAACFSSSGSLLAVGTQHGTISIFNATLLLNPEADPLITTFQSSRPLSGPGAIRDMSFCPGPFDILAWTEDRGHVGTADMRSNFQTRQIVDINSEADFEHIGIFDRNTIDPRLLESRSERRDSVRSGSAQEATPPDLTPYPGSPLVPQETQILEAIQADRRRQRERTTHFRNAMAEQRPARGTEEAPTSATSSTATDGNQQPRQRSSSTSRVVGELLGNYRDHRERIQDRVRATRQLIREANERSGTRLPDARWLERLGDTVTALRDQRDRQDTSYLSVLEILQRHESDRGDEPSVLAPLVNNTSAGFEESAVRSLAPDHGVFEVPPSPDNTAGLAWSQDGRTL